jgi:adenosylhomocysteine nucleosidase
VDEEIGGLTHADGTANPAAVARYLVRHRNAIPRLARLAKGSNLAAIQAANAAIMAVTRSVNS